RAGAPGRSSVGDRRARPRRAFLRRDRGARGRIRGRRAQAREPWTRRHPGPDGKSLMREDFVTQLRLQLRDAAEREARRGRFARTVRALRWDAGAPVLVIGAAIAAA